MNKQVLENLISEGKSTREIGVITNLHHNTVSYWVHKYNLSNQLNFKKTPNYQINKIDDKDKAYLLGFIVADGSITIDKTVEIAVQIQDKEVVEYIAHILNSTVRYDYTHDPKLKRFPRARVIKKINDISTFIGGDKKQDRHFPICGDKYAKYLLQGLFDADGCITWGRRKDKNRVWHKISITSSLKILTGVQQFLIKKLEISTIVRPKTDSDCYIIEFSNRQDVLKFLNYIYSDDYIILNRKYLKANALRLELEENDEGVKRQ